MHREFEMRGVMADDSQALGDSSLEFVLNECLEAMNRSHASLSDCLAKYPDYAGDLAPLLETATALQAIPDVHPSSVFRRTMRRKLLTLPEPPRWNRRLMQALRRLARSKL